MLPHYNVVRNLNQVIHLCTFTYFRISPTSPVYSGIGPYLNIIFNDNAEELRLLRVAVRSYIEAKPILANTSTWV
eukprot:CAMPEP_0184507948 /NCGR_PEP_ID=MMETSP0198_2-20121128/503_1 /TAXON_ID=1112570 /ORGANISM="Thraustochytrium sp., Strain LLF1b" /LENGTH=74 /DNA_ID=CAMNT_0026897707 /DNA_START=327 /DNA_END=551 /DNA_ORIENTATION=-